MFLGLLGAGPAWAQCEGCAQAGDVTAPFVPDLGSVWALVAADSARRVHPAATINTPIAFGARWGQVHAGAAYQHRIRYDDWRDGILTLGAGLGDPVRAMGLDVTVQVLDTYDEFAKDRSLSLKLHRRLPFRSAVAVGYENIWHTDGTDGGDSRYVVASTVVGLRQRIGAPLSAATVSVGLGDDRFLSEAQFARRAGGVNVFGSLALRLIPSVSGLVNWSGQDLNLGLSVAPFRRVPVVLTPVMLDVTGRAGDGVRGAVAGGLGYDVRW